jgi:hypothetical protein
VGILYPNSDPVSELLARLEKVKAKGESWTALCPAHDDSNPSLSVSTGEDGRALVNCHAGCTAEQIVAAVEMEMKDLFAGGGGGAESPKSTAHVHTPPENPHRKAEKGVQGPNAQQRTGAHPPEEGVTLEQYAEYTGLEVGYLRSLGLETITYQGHPAVRIPYLSSVGEDLPESTRFRRSLTTKPKVKSKSKGKLALYGLGALEESREKGFVLIVEGESDCHVAWSYNVPALGVPGANGFKSEWCQQLEGFDKLYVVVEPDQGGETLWESLAREAALQERLYRVSLGDVKDLRDLHLADSSEEFADRLQGHLDDARAWLDIAESEAAERAREAWESCKGLAGEYRILDTFYSDLKSGGVVGEEQNTKILYLALTSRLLERPVSVAVKGPSSAGKSFLVEQVTQFFPEAAVYALTAMSERVLLHSKQPIKHRHLILYEAAGIGSDFQTYLLRSLLSEGRLRYEYVDKTKDGLEPRLVEREGPTGLIVTTTQDSLHHENETRMISLAVVDTKEQTKAIFRALAEEEVVQPDLEQWTALQEWIASRDARVLVPFAGVLADEIPALAVRLRRDFAAILNLVRANALLHQATRHRDEEGRILATVEDDYAVVRELVADLVAEGVDANVPATMRETVRAVETLCGSEFSEEHATTARVAEELNLDRSSASRRIGRAIRRGYIKNLEDRKGRPGRFVVADPIPPDIVVLPTVEGVVHLCKGVQIPDAHPKADTYADSEEGVQVCTDSGGYTPPSPPSPDDGDGDDGDDDGAILF